MESLGSHSWTGPYSAYQAYRRGDTAEAVLEGSRAAINGIGLTSSLRESGRFLRAALGGRASLAKYLFTCFGAGTPLLTPEGSKPIEQFRAGDLVLSRSELDPEGPVEAKVVEETFIRTARTMRVGIQGQFITTTVEHPFYAQGKGWTSAGELRVGDRLLGHDGRWISVEKLLDTGEYETVYNLRVADYHTYFVGGEEWGFSVWAHNAPCTLDKNGRWHDENGQFTKRPPASGPITASRMRQIHIIYGGVPQKGGGGHSYRARAGAGDPTITKSRSPKKISDAEIIDGAERIANDPASYPNGVVPLGNSPRSRYTGIGYIRGYRTKVAVAPLGEGIITAHPEEI